MSKAYEQAGVNIEAGYEAVKRMKSHVERTNRLGVMGTFGGFGGMFDLSSLGLKEPVLISGTDGVGTKLKLAFMVDKHDTIGIDCVAMCVNDIVAQGAEPLYFLDYVALGKAEPAKIEQIVKGVADGCVQSGAALIGGETAEMPGLYEEEEYDLAGFAVGATEKSNIVTGEKIVEGDVLVGLASSGVHSNGFSLVRKIVFADNGYAVDQIVEEYEDLGPIGEALLVPTKIYAKPVLEMLKEVDVHGMAHVTGGGFYENLPRMMRDGLATEIDLGSWPVLRVFELLKDKGFYQIGFSNVLAATNTELVLFKDWTLRVRESQCKNPRLLVLIHGWTGDETSMWIFTRGLSPDYWMIAPRALYPAESSGFSWRPHQPDSFGRPSLEMLKPAADALIGLVDEYSASVKLDALQFDLVGFSQGAAMVNLVGMLYPHRVRKIGVLAGFVPSGLEELVLKKPLAGKNIFVAHGTQDQMVPIDRARASIEMLEQAGAQVTYCEDEVGHKLSANCLHALEKYLASPHES